MTSEYLFLEPVDVLYLRGNKLFGQAGEHAEAEMPPWPSLFAGAIRSRILVDHTVDLARFAGNEVQDPAIRHILGTPSDPGTFRISHVSLARRTAEGVESIVPLPADLVVVDSSGRDDSTLAVHMLQPVDLRILAPVEQSSALPYLPVLRVPGPAKSQSGVWMNQKGLADYLRGGPVAAANLVYQESLWKPDARLGIGLNAARRAAEKGRIYTTDAIAPRKDVGFLVGVSGCPGLLPEQGLVRLGGDGRGAEIVKVAMEEPWSYVPGGPRFRMILSTPGLSPGGWIPPGIDGGPGDYHLVFKGFRARLLAAVLPRHQVVSGWDIARHRPKPAERAVPAGSVYWFEKVDGDISVLKELIDEGLWPLIGECESGAASSGIDPQRRAEGFNNVWFAEWK